MNFLGVILDESLTWRPHIKTVENKISKNLGILFRAKEFLDVQCLKQLYFSFVHSYLTYCNIAWGSTNSTKLRKLYNKQKHACRIIFGDDKYTSVTHRFQEIRALNIFQINIHQVLTFMFRIKYGNSPAIFNSQFKTINHKYSTRYSKLNYQIPNVALKSTRFSIKFRGPHLWNSLIPSEMKTINSLNSFKYALKKQLLTNEINELLYF